MKNIFSFISLTAVFATLAVVEANAAPIPFGFSKIEVGNGTNAITVFTYKPKDYTNGPLIVVFHGLLRNAEDYCHNAAPLAERCHAIIAAPLFGTNQFSNEEYQRGGVISRGVVQPRTNWTFVRLPEIVSTLREREGNPVLPYYFLGHSGGGQFAMRLAAMFPTDAVRIVAANPGSDLFPRRDWKYGYGFGGLPENVSDDAALKNYLAAPLTLYLGLNDKDPNHSELDHSTGAELQGKFRLERGRNCFDFAQKLAHEHGWQFNWRKVEVAGIAHDGKAMLAAQEVEDALFGAGKNGADKSP